MKKDHFLLQLIERLDEVFYIMEYPSMDFKYVSPGIVSRGYSVQEIYDNPGIMYQHLNADQREYFIKAIEDSFGKGPLTIDYPLKTRLGENKWYQSSMMLMQDGEDGQLLVGFVKDISERKNAILELQNLKAEYEDLYNNAPNGYHSLDANGNIIRINDTELKWLGYTREEMLGKPIKKFITTTSQKTFDENFPKVLALNAISDLHLELVRKDGTILHCLLNASIKSENESKMNFTRTILTDISELKESEDRLRHSQMALEAINQELKEANRRLERLNLTKDVLLKIVSHDLRNPLETVKMISGLLSEKYEDLDPGTLLKYLDYISQSSSHATDILDDMTGMLNLDNDLNFKLKKTAIAPILEEAIAPHKNRANEKNIAMLFERSSDLDKWQVNVDAKWMVRAMDNLITNALKFTYPNGEVKVGCQGDGQEVVLYVEDNGMGISEEVQQTLFNKFMVKSQHGTAGEMGTGLGLSIVKQIIDMQIGEIKVESTKGKGSRFEIRLPMVN